MRRLLRSMVVLVAMLPLACSSGSDGGADDGDLAPFQYRSSEDVGVSLTVTRDGAPVVGASVSIVEVLRSADVADAVGSGVAWLTAGTDADGLCASLVSIPTRVELVDVVVHHDGSRGPFTDEALREYWGPFAPSSRQTVRVVDLGAMAIALEAR